MSKVDMKKTYLRYKSEVTPLYYRVSLVDRRRNAIQNGRNSALSWVKMFWIFGDRSLAVEISKQEYHDFLGGGDEHG